MIRLTAVLLTLTLAGCTSSAAGTTGSEPTRPNIVFVLTDDLSMNLIQYMPHVQGLAKAGVTFANYTVTDSLCCPSRSSMFTGKFPHNTGVFTNGGKDGGFNVFHSRGEESSTFATSLQKAGYRTAMMGKYLNGYDPKSGYVPPGWTEWDVAGNGYPEYNYDLNENGTTRHYGKDPKDYLTDVLSGKATNFISAAAGAHQPFMIEVATFAPHAPYTPAPQDLDKFPGLTAPRGPAFDIVPSDAPPWLKDRTPLTPKEVKAIDTDFRKRVQAVQSVDRMIGDLQATLQKAGVAGATDVVFTSDNGYHMGEYRLNPGKMTAFDTDVHVPLTAAGPNFTAGKTIDTPVENIDLRPTFEQIGRATTPSDVDGRSLLSLPDNARTTALIEHHGPDNDPADPDHPAKNSGNPTTYEAIRTTQYTYVEYADGSKEYYDRVKDPNELHNIAGALSPDQLSRLHSTLQRLATCHGAAACTV